MPLGQFRQPAGTMCIWCMIEKMLFFVAHICAQILSPNLSCAFAQLHWLLHLGAKHCPSRKALTKTFQRKS